MHQDIWYKQLMYVVFYRKNVSIGVHSNGMFSAVIWMNNNHPVIIQYNSLKPLINEVCSIVRY